MRVFLWSQFAMYVKMLYAPIGIMGALYDISCPASLSYAGFAWEFLRRNPNYRIAYERSRASAHLPHKINSGGSYIRLKNSSKAAEKWGLQSFANPDLGYLEAHVFWTHEAFNQTLPIEFGREKASNLSEKAIRFSDISCTRHHLITEDGRRETVLKSPFFWLQLHGQPPSPTKENSRIIIKIDGSSGMRRRLEVLQFLADLRDAKPLNDADETRPQMFENLQFYLRILDLKPLEMSYKDMAALIIGKDRTQADWDSHGCSLKSKMVRGTTRAVELMQSDYLNLLAR